MVFELVDRRLAAGLQESTIEGLPCLERQLRLELATMRLGKRLEAGKHDPFDANWLTFLDLDLQANRLLVVAEAGIERPHARVGKPPVAIIGNDALEVGLELFAREVLFRSPREPGALTGRQD